MEDNSGERLVGASSEVALPEQPQISANENVPFGSEERDSPESITKKASLTIAQKVEKIANDLHKELSGYVIDLLGDVNFLSRLNLSVAATLSSSQRKEAVEYALLCALNGPKGSGTSRMPNFKALGFINRTWRVFCQRLITPELEFLLIKTCPSSPMISAFGRPWPLCEKELDLLKGNG